MKQQISRKGKTLKLEKIKITKLDNLNEIYGGELSITETSGTSIGQSCISENCSDLADGISISIKWLTL